MLLQKQKRTFWVGILKIVVVIGIVLLIWRLDIINATTITRIFSQPLAAVLSILAIAAAIQLNVVRWYLLLSIHGQSVPLRRLTSIVFISYFLGSAAFGTLGVDALRLYYVGRERPASVGQAYLSIAADRLIGLLGLILAGGALFILNLDQILRHPELELLVSLSLSVGGAILLASGLIVAFDRFIAPFLQAIRPFARLRMHVGLLVRAYKSSLGSIGGCLMISAMGHFMTLATLIILTHAMFSPALSNSELGLAGVIATITNQIPITPGGLAVGESVFAYICHLLDPITATSDYGSVVFTQRLLGLAAVLPGLIFFFCGRRSTEGRRF